MPVHGIRFLCVCWRGDVDPRCLYVAYKVKGHDSIRWKEGHDSIRWNDVTILRPLELIVCVLVYVYHALTQKLSPFLEV